MKNKRTTITRKKDEDEEKRGATFQEVENIRNVMHVCVCYIGLKINLSST